MVERTLDTLQVNTLVEPLRKIAKATVLAEQQPVPATLLGRIEKPMQFIWGVDDKIALRKQTIDAKRSSNSHRHLYCANVILDIAGVNLPVFCSPSCQRCI